MISNINELRDRVHAANKKWWTHIDTGVPIERNKGELLMLVITELAEAVEGIRKNLVDDKLPHRKMEEVEMADAYIRLLDYAGGLQIHINDMTNDVIYNSGNKSADILQICEFVIRIKSYGTSWLQSALQLIESYCFIHGLDLHGAIAEKLAYNATRVDHTHEHRKSENGKKF